MSHISEIQTVIRDLDALASAAKELGLELMRGQQSFRGYEGRRYGCLHALRLEGARQGAYEVGVVPASEDGGGYKLLWDKFQDDLPVRLGEDGERLQQAYAAAVTLKQVNAEGYRVMERSVRADGTILLKVMR